MKIAPSRTINFRCFGFIPSGYLLTDIKGRLFGAPNLLKRLQARDIIAALDIRPGERVLDFGCGSGYFTIELAKLAQKAIGVDVNPRLRSIAIPPALSGRLEFLVAEGQHLPFPDGHFDRVLASEILPMTADPREFLREIRRVLRPKGRLLVVNGAGHPAIRDAYGTESGLLRALKRIYPQRVPPTYEDYCRILQESFGTAQNRFLDRDEVCRLLESCEFEILDVGYSPGCLAGAFVSWSQFVRSLRTGKTLSQGHFPVDYFLLGAISLIERRKYEGGLLCVASR